MSTRACLVLLALSFGLTAVFPLLGLTPLADLNDQYTDHLRQPYAAWVFVHRGAAMYSTPLGEAAQGIDFRQPTDAWLNVPYVYPPGAVAVFLPLAAIGQWIPMTQHHYAQVGILYLLLLSHVAFWAVLRTLRAQPPGARGLVGAVTWLVFIHLALQAQYEAVWIGCGALALDELRADRPRRTLVWICVAALLHYRALILAPVGLVALVRAIGVRPVREWPWPALSGIAATGIVVIWSFVLMTPGAAEGGAAKSSFYAHPDGARIALIALLTFGFGALALQWADRLAASMVGIAGLLALVDTHHWWHAAMVVLVPLSVGALRVPARPAWARIALTGWIFVLQPLSWGGTPFWLFRSATRYLRLLSR